MGKVVCIAGQASATGKTTTAVNLALGLSVSGRSTLLIDFTPEGAANRLLDNRLAVGRPLAPHPIVAHETLDPWVLPTRFDSLSLLGGGMTRAQVQELDDWDTACCQSSADRIREIGTRFDWILIDCPSTLGGATAAAMRGADEVLLPIRCQHGALESVPPLVQLIRKLVKNEGKKLDFSGVLITHYDPGMSLAAAVEQDIRDFFGDIVFETVIPRDAAFATSMAQGKPILESDPRACGTLAYLELCMEVLGR